MTLTYWRMGIGMSCFLFVLLLLCDNAQSGRKKLHSYEEFLKAIYEGTKSSSFYRRKQAWLEQMGATYHFGKWFSVNAYFMTKWLICFLCLWIGANLNVIVGVVMGLLVWLGFDVMIVALNRRDNHRMLRDMKLIYRSLEIQTKAGVYLTDALSELYFSVKEKRLQEALLSLSGELVMEGNIYEALMHFKGRFENAQIDTMCIIILQALETGQATQMLREMENQTKDVESLLLSEQKQKIDRSVTFYQLGIFGCMLVVIIYSCIAGMFEAAWFI